MSMLDNTCNQSRDFDLERAYRYQLRGRAEGFKRFEKRQYRRLSRRAGRVAILHELITMTKPDPPTPVTLPYYPETDNLWRILLAGARNYWNSDAPSRHEWACAAMMEDYEYQASWCDTETREEL